jgi:hypothetical protein
MSNTGARIAESKRTHLVRVRNILFIVFILSGGGTEKISERALYYEIVLNASIIFVGIFYKRTRKCLSRALAVSNPTRTAHPLQFDSQSNSDSHGLAKPHGDHGGQI